MEPHPLFHDWMTCEKRSEVKRPLKDARETCPFFEEATEEEIVRRESKYQGWTRTYAPEDG